MKAQEANDLKVQNRQLMEENTRLTDLTRMLLSSQAFSGFLSELSGTAPPSSSSNPSQGQFRPQPQPSQKDVNPHQITRQLEKQQQQIGMATIPEIPQDFSLADNTSTASSWDTGISLTNFPVYSLTKLPEGPILDIGKLSGKADEERPILPLESVKHDMPNIEYATSLSGSEDVTLPVYPAHVMDDAVAGRTAFALYAEPLANRLKVSHPVPHMARHMTSATATGSHLDHHTRGMYNETAAASRLVLMCSRLDAISARIAAVTSHLA